MFGDPVCKHRGASESMAGQEVINDPCCGVVDGQARMMANRLVNTIPYELLLVVHNDGLLKLKND